MLDITIVTPVKEDPRLVDKFIAYNKIMLKEYPLIVIDSVGGSRLEDFAIVYQRRSLPLTFWEARKVAYKYVDTKYIFNLDCGVVPSKDYLTYVLCYFNNEDVGAVSTFIINRNHKGKLAFGVSIWRTELLKKLYDYNPNKMPKDHRLCECIYMWDKLEAEGYKLRPSMKFAKHLNIEGGNRK